MGSRWWAGALAVAWTLSACNGEIELDGNVGSGGSVASGGGASVGSGGAASGGAESGGEPLLTGGAPVTDGGSATGTGGGEPAGGDAGYGGAPGQAGGEMVLLPAGTFLMGHDDDITTSPMHERTLEAFWIDKTEVAAGAYDLCVLAQACTPADPLGQGVNSGVPGWENYPANYVTLRQAEAYCAWVGKRLPTEAEWEYAAGGLQGYEYPWGDATGASCHPNFANPPPEYSDYWHGCAIGQFPPNENGLLDVGGSMYEYTSSLYCGYSEYTDTGYIPGCIADKYALRDGAFSSFAKELARVSFRQGTADDFTHYAVGFRCAASP